MVDRRTVTAGLIGLGALPAHAAGNAGVVEGEPTWSESAMVLYFDEALRNGYSLRISRYPEKNATWVWLHVLLDGSRVQGSAETVQRYRAPIFGRRWYGRIVRAEAGGRRMVGMINDWKPDEQPYGPS